MTECNAIIEANNEIDNLKRENKKLNELCVKYGFEVGRLEEENEQLKKQKAKYKRLSEIRNEEINNRILTIKEFMDNCSNEKVKEALEDLFYSEVNEYDLSKKYRKLREENKQLKMHMNSVKAYLEGGHTKKAIERLKIIDIR